MKLVKSICIIKEDKMKYTNNYNLQKPEGMDEIDIRNLNQNADKIDELLFELKQDVETIKAQTKNLIPQK